MLRTHPERVLRWEPVLPGQVRRPPVEPERVDRPAPDEVTVGPFGSFVDPGFGRPSTPVETYLLLILGYLTELGLPARAISWIAATGQRLQTAGAAVPTMLRDRSRAAGTTAHGIAVRLQIRSAQRRDQARAVMQRITRTLAELTKKAAENAEKVLVNARRAVKNLTEVLDATRAAFRRTVNGAPESEGRISTHQPGYRWDRTRNDHSQGTRIWTGHQVPAHNPIKITARPPRNRKPEKPGRIRPRTRREHRDAQPSEFW